MTVVVALVVWGVVLQPLFAELQPLVATLALLNSLCFGSRAKGFVVPRTPTNLAFRHCKIFSPNKRTVFWDLV